MPEFNLYLDGATEPRAAVLGRAAQAASGLHQLGVREGDVVALLLRNDFVFFEAQHAAALLGAYCVPINWHGTAEEVCYVLGDARPKVLVAHADLLAPLRRALPDGLQVLVVPTPASLREAFHVPAGADEPWPGEPVWRDWVHGFAPWDQPMPRSRATLIYTSGTTGNPKGVKREPASPEQAAGYMKLMAQVYGIEPGMRALVGGPMYHASPNAYIRQALHQAEALVLQSKFDPEATLAAIERYRISHAVMVPTMFVRLLKLPDEVRRRYDVSSLKWVLHTGAPCAAEVKKAILDWWGPVVYETYGGTEVGIITLSTPQDWLAHPGSAGRLAPGAQIAIYGEDGQPVAPGQTGEIFMRNDVYSDFTYLGDDAKRRAAERNGMVSLGDVGYVKDDRLYLCDRRSDMVISAGVNIYPAEVESVLVQCPGVRDCAVFGIPDEDFGESLAAAVELQPGAALTAQAVRDYLVQRLAKYKVPARIEFHPQLPREESGKIFKRRLRDPYWQGAGRKI